MYKGPGQGAGSGILQYLIRLWLSLRCQCPGFMDVNLVLAAAVGGAERPVESMARLVPRDAGVKIVEKSDRLLNFLLRR